MGRQPWHIQNLLNFINPDSWGVVEHDSSYAQRDLSRVVGFVPHGFGSIPAPPRTSADSYSSWQIDSLSLVSILKHRPAAVYVSDNLPNMDELKSVPTRPLDQFESGSLERLNDGEEVVVAGGFQHLQMLGSIRAARQCRECHQVPRGTLLGAFSYRLSRKASVGDSLPSDSLVPSGP